MLCSSLRKGATQPSSRTVRLAGAAIAAGGPLLGAAKWLSGDVAQPEIDGTFTAVTRDSNTEHLYLWLNLSNDVYYNSNDYVFFVICDINTTLATALTEDNQWWGGQQGVDSDVWDNGTGLATDGPPSDDENRCDVTATLGEDGLGLVSTGTSVGNWWVWVKVTDESNPSSYVDSAATGPIWFSQP